MRVYPVGLAVVALLGLALALPRVAPTQGRWEGRGPEGWRQWEEGSERAYGPGYGVGRELMTKEEWLEHRDKMRTLGPDERERYREEWHKKMVERAREKGITLPDKPGRGPGPGARWGRGRGYGRTWWGPRGERAPGRCWW